MHGQKGCVVGVPLYSGGTAGQAQEACRRRVELSAEGGPTCAVI